MSARLGIRGKLFLVSLSLIVVSVAALDAYLTRVLDADLSARIRDDLVVRLRLVARDAALAPFAADDRLGWDALADELGDRARARATIIRADGFVLGDSEVALADLAHVENHLDRPEIAEAAAHGQGMGMRESATVRQRLMYVAVPFRRADGLSGFARLAVPLDDIDHAIARLRRLLGVGFLLALALAVVMSSGAAQVLSRAVRALTAAARRMAAGDLAVRTRTPGRDEIAELGGALDQLAGNLSRTLGELRTERDLLGRILEGMREGVLVLDGGGRVVLLNPALKDILLLGSEAVGQLPLEAIRNADLQELLDRVRAGGGPDSGEIDVPGLKPRRLLVHASILPGEPAGMLAVFVDVTEIRRLESMRKEFVANASHELRTPVTAVRSAAETLRGAMERDPGAAARFVDIIERNAERLQGLVEDLLDLSRIESKEFKPTTEMLALDPLVQRVLSLFRERADKKRIVLRTDIPADAGQARGDRRAVEQVLSNLVDNAVKYAGDGARVTIAAAHQNGSVRLSVADTGPGIEARHLARLFERFYRVDPGRSRDMGGTGLGLSIVKHLVEAMGGRVGVESTPGQGSTFSFTLPTEGAPPGG